MFWDGCIAFTTYTFMGCYAFHINPDFHFLCVICHLGLLTDILIRHAVEVPLYLEVVGTKNLLLIEDVERVMAERAAQGLPVLMK
jgi:hypothetical protein